MIVRDRDVLLDVTRAAGCRVYMSVPTVDEEAWRILEPGTAHPLQRLRAVRELVDAGINAGVLMAPIVPGFSSSRDKLERTVKSIADHGARFVGCNVMYLQDGTRVRISWPSSNASSRRMVPRYERLYGRNTRQTAYRKELQGMVRMLQDRHGLSPRDAAGRPENLQTRPEPEQGGFSW